jgi:hypothetical protein
MSIRFLQRLQLLVTTSFSEVNRMDNLLKDHRHSARKSRFLDTFSPLRGYERLGMTIEVE